MSFSRSGNNNSNNAPVAGRRAAAAQQPQQQDGKAPPATSGLPRPPPAAPQLVRRNSNPGSEQQHTPRRRAGLMAATASSSARSQQATSTTSSSSQHQHHQQQQRRTTNAAGSNSDTGDDNDEDDAASGPLWVALKDGTPVHAVPNGPQVGEAAAGTVIEEYRSMVDMFGAQWIASVSDDESLVWVRRYEKGDHLGVPRAPLWELKSSTDETESASAAAAAPVQPSELRSTIICPTNIAPLKHPSGGAAAALTPLVTEFSLILDFLSSPIGKATTTTAAAMCRDWNTEYQVLVEKLLFLKEPEEEKQEQEQQQHQQQQKTAAADKVRSEINALFTDFAGEVEESVTTIVSELAEPQGSRKIKAFQQQLGVYFNNGVVYRMNLDNTGTLGGDKNAMKVASQAFRAHSFVAAVSPMYFLHRPLVMVMTYRGFRITASSIPPLRSDGLVAGSIDGGRSFLQPQGFFVSIFDDCMEQLGLAPHQVKVLPHRHNAPSTAGERQPSSSTATASGATAVATSITTSLPVDTAIIAGWDQRLYFLNVGRVLPPVAPVREHKLYNPAASGLFWRMRPELVNRIEFRLSPDAFIPNASHVEDNEDVISATSLLRDAAVPSVAAVLGFLEPTLAPTVTLEQCASCKKRSEGHLVFAVCERECCQICPQCCLGIEKLAFWDGKPELAEAKLKEIIKPCTEKNGSMPRTLKGFVMTPDLTTIMHSHGVNMRYLSMVYGKIPRSAFHCTGHYVEIEMIARSAKHMLSEILRKAADTDTANKETAQFFVSLLQPAGPQAERFWAEELGPAIMKNFDVVTPFDTETLDRDLVYKRVSELTGVQFSQQSVRSLLTEKPFVQMLPPRPVLKEVQIPMLVERAGERREYLEKYGGLLGVFWSGLEETEAEKVQWRAKRPAYLSEE